MFRCVTGRRGMRVVCLTAVPGGGAMTAALKKLGYTPYTLRSCFQHGHAVRDPVAWAAVLAGDAASVDMRLFADHDSVVGPPASVAYDRLLRGCPDYTKVILVEEADKERWARDYEAHVGPLLQRDGGNNNNNNNKWRLFRRRRRVGRSRIAKAFDTMIHKMTPHCEAAAGAGGYVAALERYEAQVRSDIDKRRLLVYRHGDGWGPLCAFLEKDVPAEPFPPYESGVRVIGNLQERIERTEKLSYLGVALLCGGVVYTVYPALGSIKTYVTDMYSEYQTAYNTK